MLLAALAVCAGCHPDHAAHYARTGMGRSFAKATVANVPVTAKPFHHALSDTWFSLVRRGQVTLHRRWLIEEGRESNVEELTIHYVMGSGNHAKTFLHRNARGQLVELPLGWYAEKGGTFGMNPGFDSIAPPTRRKINEDCMACHNAYPKGGVIPEGIDCARCHGDGSKHAAIAASRGARPEAIRSAIVNPALLSRARKDEVCYQCHLETTSARLPGMIRRFDRPPYSYQPGEPLSNVFFYFDHAPGKGHEEKFEIVSAAYRMRQSACFVKSDSLTCVTCHDAHGKARDTRRAPCLGCHPSAHHPASDCAECHMPKRRTEDAVHVVVTDHKIQRTPPRGDLLAERAERHPAESEEYRGEVVPYRTSPEPLPAVAPLYAALAQVMHGANLRSGIPRLSLALSATPSPPAEGYIALGTAMLEARSGWAEGAFREASRIQPDSATAQRLLGIRNFTTGSNSPADHVAANYFRKAIALDPGDAASWYQLALLDSRSNRPGAAVEKARRAIAIDPDLLDAYNSLGVNLTAMGDTAGAEKAFRDALQIDPYFATAHGNLARLLGGRGFWSRATSHFDRAIRYRPLFAPDRYDYAVVLSRQNLIQAAREQAQSAINLAPGMVDARVLLGILYAAEGRLADAVRELDSAVKQNPEHARARQELDRVLKLSSPAR